MLKQFSKFTSFCLLAIFFILVSGCSNEPKNSSVEISGSAIKGVITHGVVKAYNSTFKTLLAQTTTNQFGQFTLTLDKQTETEFLLLELSVDQHTLMRCDLTAGCLNHSTGQLTAFGDSLSLPPNFKLLGLAFLNSRGVVNTYITPLSHLIVTTALKNSPTLTNESINLATNWVINAFNLKQSPLLTQPKDITHLFEQLIVTDEQLKQSILSAAIYPETLLSDWSQLETNIDNLNLKEILSRALEISDDLNLLSKQANLTQEASLNRATQDVQSQLAKLNSAEIIVLTQPSSISSDENKPFSLSAQASSDLSLSYQWYKDNVAIPQANTNTFTKLNAELSDEGVYHVEISNSETLIKSLSARVSIHKASEGLKITQQPSGLSITAGDPILLNVTASGEGQINYQWQKDGSLIPGASSASFYLATSNTKDAGSYRVVVSNASGQVYSNFVNVWVNEPVPPIAITSQPESLSVPLGVDTSLSVGASGGGFIGYQWRKNGIAIANATSSNLAFSSVTAADSGIYDVIVSNSQGSQTSSKATLSVISNIVPVSISSQPISQTIIEGSGFSISVGSSGDAPINYQWLLNGSAITNANSAIYQVTSATLKDQGDYSVIVSNSGSTELSKSASIIIQENAQHSIVLSWETPAYREDGSPLNPSEIKGYVIQYGNSASLLNKQVQVDTGASNEYTLAGLSSGSLSLRIATVDIDNRQGLFSEVISIDIP